MGNIGDIYYAFRGDGARLAKDAQVEGAKAGTNLAKSTAANFKQSWSGANIGKGFVQGLGLAGGLAGAQLVATGVTKVIDLMGDAVTAAREDQASIARLDQSLQANARNWDGTTEAIEKTIKARQRLGFTDEDQRASLARLLPVYHDVDKSLEVQAAAMDLARFKNVDLQTATEALIKIEGGQYRGLKVLIGSTKDITNSTEALAAVRRVAAGAAEKMAKTDEGKLLDAQIRQGEALERLGYVLLPLVTEGTLVFTDVMEDLAGNLTGVEGAADLLGDTLANLGLAQKDAATGGFDFVHAVQDLLATANPTKVSGTMGVLLDTIDKLGISTDGARDQLADLGFEVERTTDTSQDDIEKMRGAIVPDLAGIGVAFEETADDSEDFRSKYHDDAGDVIRSSHRVRKALVNDAAIVRGEVFDETETRAELHQTRMDLHAAEDTKRTATSKEEARQASDDIVQALDDEGAGLEDLSTQGKLTQQDVDRFTKDAKRNIGSLSTDGQAHIQSLIDKYNALAHLPDVTLGVVIDVKPPTDADKALYQKVTGHVWGHGPLLAEGGPVEKGQPYIVGDGGRPELFVPDQSGYVYPRVPSSVVASAGSTSGGDTINVSLLDRMEVRNVRDIADGLRMIERRGYIGRR